MKFAAFLQSSAAAALLAAVAVPVGGSTPKPEPAARLPLEVKVAQADDFSRVEFHWMGGAKAASRRDGQTVILRFGRNGQPDLSQLRVFPPKWMKGAEASTVNGGLEVKIFLTDDADAKIGFADGATYVNAFARKVDAATAQTTAARSAAVPDNGTLKVSAQTTAQATSFTFPWKGPVGAAVFRHGEDVWVVFDAKAAVDLSTLPKSSAQFSRVNKVQGADFTAICITDPSHAAINAQATGGAWTVTLGATTQARPGLVNINRDTEATQPGLSAAVAGATRAVWLDDPITGDRFGVVTALAPAKGLEAPRRYVDMELLASAQGLAISPRAGDLTIDVAGDLVHLGRPGGMTLSTPQQAFTGQGGSTTLADLPQASAMPGLVDFDGWSKLGHEGFFARYDALRNAAAAEADKDGQSTGKGGPVAARMGLARFLVGSELSYEAIGELNLLAKDQPAMLGDPELRALRGAAKAMSGRYNEALVDLSAPSVSGDASVAVWRGYVAAKSGHWDDAKKGFQAGFRVMGQMGPKWRAKLARAYAEAALETGDMKTAKIELSAALDAHAGPEEDTATSFLQARIIQADGDNGRALAIYDTLAGAPNGALASAGLLHATQLRIAMGKMKPTDAADIYDGLRYRWRGDATELESIRALGQIYMSMGRYREALETLRSAGARFNDLPQANLVQADMYNDFKALFMDGGADGWEPIQAVALWTDFQGLTPIGAEGDLMVRKMARRLVDVDLLSQAAVLLKWQVDNRLDGMAKAQVATDLASIFLMNRQPEQALDAINSSRTTVLPNAMNIERRALSARALIALGRSDQALEILGADKSAEADDLRAEVAWKGRDWKTAGPLLEKRLGDRWKQPGPLGAEDEARLLRTAIAYSLGNDDASLARLRQHFTGFIDQSHTPEYLKIAFTGVAEQRLSPAGFNNLVSESDTFAGWVTRMKQRFREKSAPIGNGPVKQAAAAPPVPPVGKPAAPAPAKTAAVPATKKA
jgi:tetratricopeptide (TPR) repeat protein